MRIYFKGEFIHDHLRSANCSTQVQYTEGDKSVNIQ